MKDIHIAGTGIWYPEDVITNDEIVASFNSFVDNHNESLREKNNGGEIQPECNPIFGAI